MGGNQERIKINEGTNHFQRLKLLQLLELQKNELATFLTLYFRENLVSICFENIFYPNLYLYLQTWCQIP